jgi:hypothetical protein
MNKYVSLEISASHIGLGSVIHPCPYVEIGDYRTGLGSDILPCTYVEISAKHTGHIDHEQCLVPNLYDYP